MLPSCNTNVTVGCKRVLAIRPKRVFTVYLRVKIRGLTILFTLLHLTCHAGRSFGAAKSFQSNNAPLATPRRALGDVGNTIQPATAKARKGLALKPNKLVGKTPTTTKIFQGRTGTPAAKGRSLVQQISSAGLKKSIKQKQAFHVKTTEKQRVKTEQDHLQKEVMYPFTDKGITEIIRKCHAITRDLKVVVQTCTRTFE